ncbi:MAG: T9SS type A sorting domain-containing protein [Candidatus Cloacimonadales bacterium]
MKNYIFVIAILFYSYLFSYEMQNYSDLFIDESRENREIAVEIFYPTNITEPVEFPVFIFGHGWHMNYSSYSFLTEQLVSAGAIVVFPQTETGLFPSHLDFALDLAFLENIIQLENSAASSNLFSLVMDKTIVSGHSMGGGCSILAASINDNFSGIINFAAAETDPSAISAADDLLLPTIIFSAADDNITPAEANQIPIYQNIAAATKYYVNLFGETHLGITDNTQLMPIITPFLAYLVSDENSYLETLNSHLDSLQSNNILEYESENNFSSLQNDLTSFGLNLGNYPNPFNPSTTITFAPVQQYETLSVEIFNLRGEKVKTLQPTNISRQQENSVVWNGLDQENNSVSSGIYYYELIINGKTVAAQKCLLLK